MRARLLLLTAVVAAGSLVLPAHAGTASFERYSFTNDQGTRTCCDVLPAPPDAERDHRLLTGLTAGS